MGNLLIVAREESGRIADVYEMHGDRRTFRLWYGIIRDRNAGCRFEIRRPIAGDFCVNPVEESGK